MATFLIPNNHTPKLDDESGPGSAQRPDPEHRGSADVRWPLFFRPGSADAQSHLHGNDDLPERVPADPAAPAVGQAEWLPGRSVKWGVACVYGCVLCVSWLSGLSW